MYIPLNCVSENSGGGSTKEHAAPPFCSCDIVFHINYSGIGAGFGVLLLTVIVMCGVITAQCVQIRGISLK